MSYREHTQRFYRQRRWLVEKMLRRIVPGYELLDIICNFCYHS